MADCTAKRVTSKEALLLNPYEIQFLVMKDGSIKYVKKNENLGESSKCKVCTNCGECYQSEEAQQKVFRAKPEAKNTEVEPVEIKEEVVKLRGPGGLTYLSEVISGGNQEQTNQQIEQNQGYSGTNEVKNDANANYYDQQQQVQEDVKNDYNQNEQQKGQDEYYEEEYQEDNQQQQGYDQQQQNYGQQQNQYYQQDYQQNQQKDYYYEQQQYPQQQYSQKQYLQEQYPQQQYSQQQYSQQQYPQQQYIQQQYLQQQYPQQQYPQQRLQPQFGPRHQFGPQGPHGHHGHHHGRHHGHANQGFVPRGNEGFHKEFIIEEQPLPGQRNPGFEYVQVGYEPKGRKGGVFYEEKVYLRGQKPKNEKNNDQEKEKVENEENKESKENKEKTENVLRARQKVNNVYYEEEPKCICGLGDTKVCCEKCGCLYDKNEDLAYSEQFQNRTIPMENYKFHEVTGVSGKRQQGY